MSVSARVNSGVSGASCGYALKSRDGSGFLLDLTKDEMLRVRKLDHDTGPS